MGCTGASTPLSQWCILHFPPISAKFINSPLFPQNLYISPLFPQNLHFLLNLWFFCFPLFWPGCIYASCFTRTGCCILLQAIQLSAQNGLDRTSLIKDNFDTQLLWTSQEAIDCVSCCSLVFRSQAKRVFIECKTFMPCTLPINILFKRCYINSLLFFIRILFVMCHSRSCCQERKLCTLYRWCLIVICDLNRVIVMKPWLFS